MQWSQRRVRSNNLKRVGYIEEVLSVDDIKKNNIYLFLGQVVTVKKIIPCCQQFQTEQ